MPLESATTNSIRAKPEDRMQQCYMPCGRRNNNSPATGDESLAIDGKTMCNALDEQGQRTHVMSVVGQQSKICYTQKKWAPCP